MAPRGKIVLARIDNETKRKETLRKRKSELVKKVSELATLCNVEAAVVIYSPGDNHPTVWPSTLEARATIFKYLSRPESERMANSHTAKSFAEEECKKKKNKAQRLIKMNEERNIQALIISIADGKTTFQNLDSEQKEKMNAFIDKKKKQLRKHIQKLKGKEQQTPHSPQAFPLVQQVPPAGQEASGQNINGFADGRIFPSPAAAHGQLNASGLIPLDRHSYSLPMHNPHMMLLNYPATNRLEMTRRLYGQINLGGMMHRATQLSRVFRPALQMPMVSHATRGLNMNGFAGSKKYPLPAAAAHGQHMNLTGMSRGASSPSPLSVTTVNPFVMSPNNVAAKSLNMARRFNVGGTRQNPPPSPLSPPPALSTVLNDFSAGGVPDVTDQSFIQRGSPPYMPINFPRRLGLPLTLLTQYEASGSNMIGNDHRWNRFSTPATAPLDQSNSDDGKIIGRRVDIDATCEVNNVPTFTMKW